MSATAFHWIDPEVGWAQAARLLRPGGWLALLTTGERYPEPFRTDQPAWLAALRGTTLFGEVTETRHEKALRLSAQTIIGVECARATFLSYGAEDQAAFTAKLRRLLQSEQYLDLVQETYLAMAPVAG